MRVERWDQSLAKKDSTLLLDHLCGVLLERCKPSESKSIVSSLLKEKDLLGLCTFELPLTLDCQSYRCLRQVLAFFQKRSDFTLPGIDLKLKAWETFVEAEELCSETNDIFRKYSRGGFYFHPRVESILYVTQRKISAILGDVPSLSELQFRFGPGATTQVKKMNASARRKLSKPFACSEEVLRILPDVLAEMPLWAQLDANLDGIVDVDVEMSRIDFVRKTAKTDRTIAVEPMLNGMVQLAIGDFVAERLRMFGVNLQDQTLNQRLARVGSLTGALATLDLSSASDTVACGLVESLLPFDWWDFLRQFRCSTVKTPFGLRRLEKFSTMGNGFTFALESLIFFALAQACAEAFDSPPLGKGGNSVSVYGDDIICPTICFNLLVECLNACGFKVNAKKSFSTGFFRESCGKDYYSGISVRPYYLKTAITGETLFIMHNFFVREGDFQLAHLVREFISDDLAIYGPDGYGDGHLINDNPLTPFGRDRGWAGYTFETYTWKNHRAFYKLGGDYVFPAYSIYMRRESQEDPWFSPRHHGGQGFLRSSVGRRRILHGSCRPDQSQSSYRNGLLEDSLPGVRGYKRVKVYTLKG